LVGKGVVEWRGEGRNGGMKGRGGGWIGVLMGCGEVASERGEMDRRERKSERNFERGGTPRRREKAGRDTTGAPCRWAFKRAMIP
jgi:hypothetical protein